MSSPDTTLTIYGAGHLVGKTARLTIAGLDAGTYTVAADGSMTFTFGADPGGIITPAYLVSYTTYLNANPPAASDHDQTFSVYDGSALQTVTVPILIGLDYTAKGQLIRPLAEAALQAGPGIGLGKTRRGTWGAWIVRDLFAMKAGTGNPGFLYDVPVTTDGGVTPELAIAADAPYTGVQVFDVDDSISFDGQLYWQSSGPYALVIGAAALFVEGGSRE